MAVDVDLRADPIISKPVTLSERENIDIVDITADGRRFVGLRTERDPAGTAVNVITGLFDNVSSLHLGAGRH